MRLGRALGAFGAAVLAHGIAACGESERGGGTSPSAAPSNTGSFASATASNTAGASGAGTGAAGRDEPGVVATIDSQLWEFRESSVAYANRPPLMDVVAINDTGHTFRIMVLPEHNETIAAGGTYYCGEPGTSYVSLGPVGQYDSTASRGGACSISVTEAGMHEGSRFAGTFTATLVAQNDAALTVTNGAFIGIVQP